MKSLTVQNEANLLHQGRLGVIISDLIDCGLASLANNPTSVINVS